MSLLLISGFLLLIISKQCYINSSVLICDNSFQILDLKLFNGTPSLNAKFPQLDSFKFQTTANT